MSKNTEQPSSVGIVRGSFSRGLLWDRFGRQISNGLETRNPSMDFSRRVRFWSGKLERILLFNFSKKLKNEYYALNFQRLEPLYRKTKWALSLKRPIAFLRPNSLLSPWPMTCYQMTCQGVTWHQMTHHRVPRHRFPIIKRHV